jgi:hypothetical protein
MGISKSKILTIPKEYNYAITNLPTSLQNPPNVLHFVDVAINVWQTLNFKLVLCVG